MPFKKGVVTNPGGRGKGVVGKLTKTIRDSIMECFNDLQKDPVANIKAWAKTDVHTLTEFYKIAAKFIPQEVQNTVDMNITWVENRTALGDQDKGSDAISYPLSDIVEAEVIEVAIPAE